WPARFIRFVGEPPSVWRELREPFMEWSFQKGMLFAVIARSQPNIGTRDRIELSEQKGTSIRRKRRSKRPVVRTDELLFRSAGISSLAVEPPFPIAKGCVDDLLAIRRPVRVTIVVLKRKAVERVSTEIVGPDTPLRPFNGQGQTLTVRRKGEILKTADIRS